MPVWHDTLLSKSLSLTYHCPSLVKRVVYSLGGLVDEGAIPLQFWGMLAPTWQPMYLQKVSDVTAEYASPSLYSGPDLGRWVHAWTPRKMLLYMQHNRRHVARQPPEVWRVFVRSYLPKWDQDYSALSMEKTTRWNQDGEAGREIASC